MDAIASIIILAVVTEALTGIVTRLWDRIPTALVALFWGILLAVACGADLLSALGLCRRFPQLGCIITGILMSRGSNYLHDLLTQLGCIRIDRF